MSERGQTAAAQAGTRGYLLFQVGDCRLAAACRQIHTVHDAVEWHPLTGTRDWFLGLAVVDGEVLPISDLGLFLGRARATGLVLQIAPALAHAGVRVDQVWGVSHGEPAAPNSAVDEPNCPFTRTHGLTVEGRFYRVFDLRAMTRAESFRTIAGAAA